MKHEDHKIINPNSLPAPNATNHGILTFGGNVLFLAGQIAPEPSRDIVKQCAQVLEQLRQVVTAAGGTMHCIAKLTLYVTDRAAYQAQQAALREVHSTYFGSYFPAIALCEVKSLLDDDAVIQVDGIAVITSENFLP
jgi:enamine deaminase RidA (YjgF/YER057c/UK114 family)